ncbi:MAG TPA: PQQ-binding-like beta-propeller repeat protein [Bryobacteraceae bacterium]|jgi:quinoprotein glucose dehydrogenase|nr:PQQ-binding-like beta-propeller repeat protein [Bryobacteraceae bacterium]
MSRLLGGILLGATAICFLISGRTPEPADTEHMGWRDFGGAPDSAQYSALSQINRSNVANLEISWTYSTGDTNKYFFNPLVANGLMYVLAKNNSIVALDAGTGKEVWVHQTDPKTKLITNRGINYWQSQDASERRLLYASNNLLYAIDARTGKIIPSFGKDGFVDLREGLGRDPKSLSLVQSTTPGRIFENLLILGSATNEGYGSAPGDIRAYEVRTGQLVWTFHTIPHPGEFGYDTWPKDAWKTVGGANSWTELSLDEKRGIVYVPTASPKYNFYGGDRKGADLFGDCLLALDARTGKRIWHFQMVHHDIWDYDNATAPMLLSVRHNGEMVDAVAQPSKEGFLWVFNRVTGQPLWPVEERAVPRSDVPGEETWPTQPFPLKPPPFARQEFSEKDLSPYMNAAESARFREEVRGARNEGLFTPPGLRDTVEMPGNNGGANWGGAAVDPRNGTLYVVSKDLPCMLKLEPETAAVSPSTGPPEQRGRLLYQANCQQCHLKDRTGEPPAVPSLAYVTQHLSLEDIKSTVRQGRNSMPAFPKLGAADLDALVAYLDHPERGGNDTDRPFRGNFTKTARYVSGFGFMFTGSGLSPISPPWTSLTAYDLNEGTIKWSVPLGGVPELAAKGITDTGSMFPKVGPVVTAGGLIFTGTRDRKVRAIDEGTGKVLWEKQLNTPLEGIPGVYEINGREYVVFCAAAEPVARAANPAPVHGAYVAFALSHSSY